MWVYCYSSVTLSWMSNCHVRIYSANLFPWNMLGVSSNSHSDKVCEVVFLQDVVSNWVLSMNLPMGHSDKPSVWNYLPPDMNLGLSLLTFFFLSVYVSSRFPILVSSSLNLVLHPTLFTFQCVPFTSEARIQSEEWFSISITYQDLSVVQSKKQDRNAYCHRIAY